MIAAVSAFVGFSTQASAEVVVGYDAGITTSEREAIVAGAGGVLERSVTGLRADRVSARDDDEAGLIGRLAGTPGVRYAELDGVVKAAGGAPVLPNDPYFPQQWGLENPADHDIDASYGWRTRTSCSKIAILDTGVNYLHPDLSPNIWHNKSEVPDNGRDDDGNGYVDDYYGANMITGNGSGTDRDGHGSHVAGIAGARGNNGVGVSGVCWKAQLMPVKFMNLFGRGSTSDAAEGIRYAVKMGARVINASFGSSTDSSTLHDAVNYARSKGALIVVAAGNDGVNIDKKPEYPASYSDSNILTVAATDANDKLASFSNYGEKAVDLAAPGVDIISTYLGDRYAELSGTSMAAPYVSGIASMLKAANSHTKYSDWKYAIRHKVDKPASLKNKVVYDGRANLNKALAYITSKD